MTTADTIIRGALSDLRALKAGQAPKGEVMTRMLELLNRMLGTWRVDQAVAWQNTTTIALLAAGETSLTIGPGMDLNTGNPARLEISSFTRRDSIDRLLQVIEEGQYNALALKSTTSSDRPAVANLQRGASTSVVRFWPPTYAGCEVHVVTRGLMLKFADLTTDYELADGYEDAIVANLAVRAEGLIGLAAPDSVRSLASRLYASLVDAGVEVPDLEVAGGSDAAAWGTAFGTAM